MGGSAHKTTQPRVLHVIDSLDLGGAQTVLLNLARAWPRDEFPFEVAVMHGGGIFTGAFRDAGIPVHSLSPHKFCPIYIIRLIRLLRKKRFSVLHCHLFGSNWIAKPLGAICGVPLIVSHDHCNDQLRHTKKAALFLDRLTNRFSDFIIGVSASTCSFLTKYEKVSPSRLRLIYNGVDTHEFQPQAPGVRENARRHFGIKNDEFVVGGVGRLVSQKNFARWLRVIAQLRKSHPTVCGLLAGTGPQEAELRVLAAQLGMEDAVRFAGFVTDRGRLYGALDALLVTSDYEGLPMNVLEAMAAGVPVVGSRVDGLAEILDHGEDALLAGVDREEEFADGVRELITSPDFHARIAAAGGEKVRKKFSAAIMADKVMEVYRMKNSGPGSLGN